MDSEQLGNGANVFYHYDNAGRLDSIYAKKSDNTLLYSTGASLDIAGNHTRESYFIKKDSLPFIIPQSDSITAYQYEFSTNRLTSANGQTVVSDNNGNIIKNQYSGFNSGASNATYDNLNNITSCNVDGKQYSFRYNAYNNRFIVDTFRRIVDVLNNGNVIVNKGTSGTVHALYCHSPNGLVCSIDPVTNAKKWYLYDFRGSTIAVLNDNQNVEQYYKYDPFGAIEESSHVPGTKTPFLYVGKYGVEYHSPHLYYMRARYYDPSNGRFYGEDPVWGINLFPYGDNNPINNIDPAGHESLALPNAIPYPNSQSLSGIKSNVKASNIAIIASALLSEGIRRENERVYITYQLTNPEGVVYYGRASGFGSATQVMMKRYSSHKMRKIGYANPQLDVQTTGLLEGYPSIRGREQMLVDSKGGIGSPLIGNVDNPISNRNPFKQVYLNKSLKKFGPVK